MRLAIISVLVFTISLLAAPVPKDRKKNSSFYGTWRVQEGNTETWKFNEDGTGQYGNVYPTYTGKAIFKLNESVYPYELDWSQDGGTSWHLALYGFEDDKLIINFGSTGAPRAKNLTDPAGARRIVFKRFEE
jgi:hypothetical protein